MAQTTVGGILNNVKIETNLFGVTEIDPWLIDTFNEIFQEYTALDILPQYLMKDVNLALTANTESVPLPSDLQHLLDQNIRYYSSNSQNIPQFLRKYDKYRQIDFGPPIQFIRKGMTLLLTPFANIGTGDYLLIDYYSVPATLTTADPFPYLPLIPTIKKELMARAVILTDSPAFARFKVMAKESYSKSKAILQ